jgi:hypothetical protein
LEFDVKWLRGLIVLEVFLQAEPRLVDGVAVAGMASEAALDGCETNTRLAAARSKAERWKQVPARHWREGIVTSSCGHASWISFARTDPGIIPGNPLG